MVDKTGAQTAEGRERACFHIPTEQSSDSMVTAVLHWTEYKVWGPETKYRRFDPLD